MRQPSASFDNLDEHARNFIPGKELSKKFYFEVVKPILDDSYPGLGYSAGLLGTGSEVLGIDDEMSTDHSWGPRLFLFLSKADHEHYQAGIQRTLGSELPFTFQEYSTHFEDAVDEPGTALMKANSQRPVNHRVSISVLDDYLQSYLGIDSKEDLTFIDWLTIPEQKLISITAGRVFHDGFNLLKPLQDKLSYYPRDVWLYLLSAGWARIGQEEPFVGRTGLVGDDLGSGLIAARQVCNLMRLAFLIERQYAPYSKWLGSAFSQLSSSAPLFPHLRGALRAAEWQEREAQLGTAAVLLVQLTNQLQITEPLPERLSQFHERPFYVIEGENIARPIWEAIEDDAIKALPFGVGKIDQFTDSADILSYAGRSRALGYLYTPSDDSVETLG